MILDTARTKTVSVFGFRFSVFNWDDTDTDTDTDAPDTDTDTSVVNPTRRPQPTNLQNLVTIMEYVVRVATFRVRTLGDGLTPIRLETVWLSEAPGRPGIRSKDLHLLL